MQQEGGRLKNRRDGVRGREGVSPATLRYYERLDLVKHPTRTRSGYRIYKRSDLARVRFIRQAQNLGLSLKEIRSILPAGTSRAECRRVRELIATKLADIDRRITQMRAFRDLLAEQICECDATLAKHHDAACPAFARCSGYD